MFDEMLSEFSGNLEFKIGNMFLQIPGNLDAWNSKSSSGNLKFEQQNLKCEARYAS